VGCALVAEGVETAAELSTIERLGVPLVQGFYFARPGSPWPAIGGADVDASVESNIAAPVESADAGLGAVLQPAA
jgi:EAL domain-containing protein (putative c-di-GMP-specific phosphodiesterase class I)